MEDVSGQGQILCESNWKVCFGIFSSEMPSMKEYILNLKALDVCLALHEEEFQRVLQLAGELAAEDHLSSKIRRRISNAEIEALKVVLIQFRN